MVFRIVFACVAVLLCLGLYEFHSIQKHYRWLRSPAAGFTILGTPQTADLTIVEFLNYRCTSCKESHQVLIDYQKRNPNTALIVRPVPYEGAEQAAETALAAGLQGKFWEMDRALVEYKGPLDEKFLKETASLYDMDYERMVTDSKSEEVFKLAKDNVLASQALEITATPAFMIGKSVYQLDKPLTLSDLIQRVQRERRN